MTRTFALCNQKGGVGKTTTAVNLAASLAATGKRVLLIDLDPQGNATTGCGLHKNSVEQSTAEVLLFGTPLAEACVPLSSSNFDILPANSSLTRAEIQLLDEARRESRLREALQDCAYDYVLVDCPPALNILTVNALVAADQIIVPVQCEFFALEGLDALLETIQRVAQQANPHLSIAGILRTMYDARNNLMRDVSEHLLERFADQVYRTIIPRNIVLAEAPSHGKPVSSYSPHCLGATAYLRLAGEILRREKAAGNAP